MLLFGCARNSKLAIYLAALFTLFTTMSAAALNAVSSAAVAPTEQGKLQVGLLDLKTDGSSYHIWKYQVSAFILEK
jgi:hypothetical protein